MSDFICKMCGGAIQIVEGTRSFGKCPYCGSIQTFPRISDLKKKNLYERAEMFRRGGEFDKATEILNEIVLDDDKDAECYWQLLLNEYGIEYVEDGGVHVPTINRMQYKSVYSDENYKSAVEYADDDCKQIYKDEAEKIAAIQRKVIEIIGRESPYDIFISYKQSDSEGKRTVDSVLANDLYHQLTQEGYRVFFAEISLENKIGKDFEPYIFAALSSAKIMLVVGTNRDNINAVWVRNEWQRFLNQIEDAEEKMLIPCIKDMNSYDLPEELAHMHIMDMNKIGFFSELLQGIGKVCKREEENINITPELLSSVLYETGDPEAMIRRGFMLLEDKEFERAEKLFTYVKNLIGEDERLILGNFMAVFRFSSEAELLEFYINKIGKSSLKTETREHFLSEFEDCILQYSIENYYSRDDIVSLISKAKLFVLDYDVQIQEVYDNLLNKDTFLKTFIEKGGEKGEKFKADLDKYVSGKIAAGKTENEHSEKQRAYEIQRIKNDIISKSKEASEDRENDIERAKKFERKLSFEAKRNAKYLYKKAGCFERVKTVQKKTFGMYLVLGFAVFLSFIVCLIIILAII